jgi:hypothetical protein
MTEKEQQQCCARAQLIEESMKDTYPEESDEE